MKKSNYDDYKREYHSNSFRKKSKYEDYYSAKKVHFIMYFYFGGGACYMKSDLSTHLLLANWRLFKIINSTLILGKETPVQGE